MRIAHLTPQLFQNYKGGGERSVTNVANAIECTAGILGIEVNQRIITLGDEHQVSPRSRVPIKTLAKDSENRSAMDSSSSALWEELSDVEFVHIHQVLTNFGLFATAVARSLGKIVIGTDRGGGHNNLMVQVGGALLDGVVAQTAFAASIFRPFYPGPIHVATGPVDTDYFKPGNRVRSTYLRRVLAVGRILPHKGFEKIINCCGNELELRIIGAERDAHYLDYLMSLARGRQVMFLHDVSDEELLDEYRNADALVHASTVEDYRGHRALKAELMGNVPLEAMACGLPVIVANTTSLPELIIPGISGYGFSSAEELRGLLRRMAEGSVDLEKMGKAARSRAVDHFSYVPFGKSVISFYSALRERRR